MNKYRQRIAAPLIQLVCFGGAYLMAIGLLGNVSVQAVAAIRRPVPQQQAPPPAATFASPASTHTRRQAYQRFVEAQRLKGEAQRTRNTRLFDEAIRAYQETLRLDPTAPEPHIDLGELYFFFQSRRDLAEREAQEAIRLDPKHVGGHLLLARVYVYTARMENNPRSPFFERAVGEYEKVVELDAHTAEGWAMLADLYALKNDASRVIRALERWAAAPAPTDTLFYNRVMNADLSADQAWYRLSQLYLNQNKNHEAVEAARRAYEANPESNDYARNLIGILRAAGTSADEIRIYAQLLKSAATPALMIGYASALVRAGHHAEAIEKLQEFVSFDPSNASAVALLAIAQRRAGRRTDAITTLKTGLARIEAGTRTDLALELAQTYEELGNDAEAIAQYEQLLDGFVGKGPVSPAGAPLLSEVVSRLARVYRRVGNPAKLQAALTRVRRVIDEHNPLLDLITIEGLREEGKRPAALDLLASAIRRYPEERSLRLTEALTLSEMKRPRESIERLRAMLKGGAENATDDASIHLILSNVQMQSGQLGVSEASARRALELNPDDPEATVQLASVLDRAGRAIDAEKLLRELLQREPDNATALNNLGYLLTEHGARYQEAVGLIEQATAIDPTQGNFLDSLGWAYYKLGNLEKARLYLEKAATYTRRNATVHEHLGDVLRDSNRLSEARREWERALEYSIEADETARLKVKLKDGK